MSSYLPYDVALVVVTGMFLAVTLLIARRNDREAR